MGEPKYMCSNIHRIGEIKSPPMVQIPEKHYTNEPPKMRFLYWAPIANSPKSLKRQDEPGNASWRQKKRRPKYNFNISPSLSWICLSINQLQEKQSIPCCTTAPTGVSSYHILLCVFLSRGKLPPPPPRKVQFHGIYFMQTDGPKDDYPNTLSLFGSVF